MTLTKIIPTTVVSLAVTISAVGNAESRPYKRYGVAVPYRAYAARPLVVYVRPLNWAAVSYHEQLLSAVPFGSSAWWTIQMRYSGQ